MGSRWKWESRHRPETPCLAGLVIPRKKDLFVTDLGPHHQDTSVGAPGHGEGFTTDIQLGDGGFRSGVPEPDGAIGRATGELDLPNRVEQDLFHGVTMASQLSLTSRTGPFGVPHSHRFVICARGNQPARGIP